MKLKKILAALISMGIIASSTVSVSAAFTFETDADSGMVFITELPDRSEVEARKPTIAVNVENIPNAEFSSVDSVYNTQYAKKTDAETGAYIYDMYRVTYTISNVGDLALGYLDDPSGVGLIALNIKADFGDTVANVYKSKNKVAPITSYTTEHAFVDSILTYRSYTTALANPYPFFGDEDLGSISNATEFSMVALYVLKAGDEATFSLTNDTYINYSHLNNGVANNIQVFCTLPTNNSFTLAPAPADVPATGVTITNAPETAVEIGYAATLGATVTPDEATDKTVTWSSSAPTIVSVNAETGAIEALAAGEAVITATCGTVSDTVTITVNEPAPAAFDFVVGTCKAIDAGTKKGFVWVANKMLNVNTAEKTYTAVFSTADDEKRVALDLTAAVEAPEATIVFDAVLTTNKLNVNFNVIEN